MVTKSTFRKSGAKVTAFCSPGFDGTNNQRLFTVSPYEIYPIGNPFSLQGDTMYYPLFIESYGSGGQGGTIGVPGANGRSGISAIWFLI